MPYKDPIEQKEAKHKSYLKHKEKVRHRSVERKAQGRLKIALLKEASPCKDCNKFYPYYVMQYDHLGGDKEFLISTWVNDSLNEEKLMKEIAKCDLVCANCHAIRTYFRMFGR